MSDSASSSSSACALLAARPQSTRSSNPSARRATAPPMRPRPTMPSVDPVSSSARNPSAHEPLHSPARTRRSPSTTRRACGEDQRPGQVGGRGVEHARRVRHRHTGPAEPFHAEPVVADAEIRDEPQRRKIASRRSARSPRSEPRRRLAASSGPTSRRPARRTPGPGYRRVARTFKPRVSHADNGTDAGHACGTACWRSSSFRLPAPTASKAAVGPRPRSGTTTRSRRTRGPWTRRHSRGTRAARTCGSSRARARTPTFSSASAGSRSRARRASSAPQGGSTEPRSASAAARTDT